MPNTHDYTLRFWGHDYYITKVINKGKKIIIGGFGHGINKGDYLLLPNAGNSTRYKVNEIEYKSDPPDMWNATASFSPRK